MWPSLAPHGVKVAGALAEGCRMPVAPQGWHRVLDTPRGRVHLFEPDGYDEPTAGIVIYVHGYYTDVDGAWLDHDLGEQFIASQRNAVFIVPEAPRAVAERVTWDDLPELLSRVGEEARLPLPDGPVIAIAHGGGFRTLLPWLDSRLLDGVVLLDGLFAGGDELAHWLDDRSDPGRIMVLVGAETATEVARLASRFPDAVAFASVPAHFAPSRDSRGRLLVVWSQYEHMEIVTEGRVIPAMLELMPLDPVRRGAGRASDMS